MQARNDEDEKKLSAQFPAHVSPAMRIYRHAFEAIFGMLNLADLSRALAVSRSWSAAVRSMAPIHGTIARGGWMSPLPPIDSIIASPLLRHIAVMHVSDEDESWARLDNASLALLSQHAPNLQSLCCELALMSTDPVMLPAKLQSLQLRLDGAHTAPSINGVLTVLAALPSLSHLRLCMKTLELPSSDVDLSLLGSCRSITDLTFETADGGTPRLSVAQMEQIRSPLGALQRIDVGEMWPEEIERFLQPPVTARWRDIGQVGADARTGELLLRLPSLTKLDLSYKSDTAHVDFLPQLPQLMALKLNCSRYGGGWFIPTDALLASLVRCTGLTDLDLTCGFHSAHWSALFAHLLHLKKLEIRQDLETLACFASGPITDSLEDLILGGLRLPSSEVRHLSALRRLRSLRLEGTLASRLDHASLAIFSPPTARMPSLISLFHSWITEDGEWDAIERQAPAWE